MKGNRMSMAHRSRLNLLCKLSRQNLDKPCNLEICSTAFTLSKDLHRHFGSSKEKQEKKIVLKQNLRVNQDKDANSLKIRSMSSNLEPNKVLSSISNFQIHPKQATTQQLNKSSPIHLKIGQLIEQLKKRFIIFQTHHSSYTIKKDQFHSLLCVLIKIGCCKLRQTDEDDPIFFTKTFEEMERLIVDLRRDVVREKMKAQSQTYKYTIKRSDYLHDTTSLTSQIEALNKTKSCLLEQIDQITKFKNQISRQVSQKRQEFNHALQVIQNGKSEINKQQAELSAISHQLASSKQELANIKQASEKIGNYVGSQANKIIAMASEQYKTIQADIYEYASYLQCNQLASSLDYEPISITCLTEGLEDSLKSINRTLIQNEQMATKEKWKLMRDFLLKWMNKYKKKDEEQKELMSFKTKCVQNFIEKMKKWLDNWTLKQEYLVSLRDQFAADTMRVHALLTQLPHQACAQCNKSLQPTVAALSQTYSKIEQNYKLGNSFY